MVTVADLGVVAVTGDGADVVALARRDAAHGDKRRSDDKGEDEALHSATLAHARARGKSERPVGLPAMAHRMLRHVMSVRVAPIGRAATAPTETRDR